MNDNTMYIKFSNLDIYECDDSNICNGNGICVNTQESFKCICNDGFVGEYCELKKLEICMYEYLTL